MTTDELIDFLENPSRCTRWLRSLGIVNGARALENLATIAGSGVTIDLLAEVCTQLGRYLPEASDPDMALNNFERFLLAARSRLGLAALLARDETALPILLRIFSTSQYLSDLMIRDTESYDALRLTEGQPIARQALIDDLATRIGRATSADSAMLMIRAFKHREILRIAYGDIIAAQRVDDVTIQLSYVADAICNAALQFAHSQLRRRFGDPQTADGQSCRFVVLALGKLGGMELNYSSDVDLIALYETDGQTEGAHPIANRDFFDRVVRDMSKIISETTELGIAYRVDLRLRPDGSKGPITNSLKAALQYYDLKGRTWERQAFIKARPIAGDLDLGQTFLAALEPWVFHRNLRRVDISGIRALKRKIEKRAVAEGVDERNIKTGHGGIRDIEFVIQFLQLLNGHESPLVKTPNTLDAIDRLQRAGCLTMQESVLLQENYSWLRKLEHRLQIMFDLQTHTLPEDRDELTKVAIRMSAEPHRDREIVLRQFNSRLAEVKRINRRILDHLLHDAFQENGDQVTPEADLILDPEASQASVELILRPYGFEDLQSAYQDLQSLAEERTLFLSQRRCRHFLAAIAGRLLQEIAKTPDPDATLKTLNAVSDSIGGKVVLWELFSFHPPSMELCIKLCACCPYLTTILRSNPGMIDGLMDSLTMESVPSTEFLRDNLAEVTRGVEDLTPVLQSFKNDQHLRVGVRDILGRDSIRDTHRTLADVAELTLTAVVDREYEKLSTRLGEPQLKSGETCELVVLAMGKLGGREPNYHSDLDVIFLYQGDGNTHHVDVACQTTNQHFFSKLGTKIIKGISAASQFGRLYELDCRLRPTGKSGSLAVSLSEFQRYFLSGQGQTWERQALCKARPIFGSTAAREEAERAVKTAIFCQPWSPSMAEDIRNMRLRMQKDCNTRNLKRAEGGAVDVEFAVQLLQLRHGEENPAIMVPGTIAAIEAITRAGYLKSEEGLFWSQSYQLLRNVEARLRLMNITARHDLPTDPDELDKLAFLTGYPNAAQLESEIQVFRKENRTRFLSLVDEAAKGA